MPDEVFPFFELDWRGDIQGTLATIVGGDAGVKLRTGGLAAEDFPLWKPRPNSCSMLLRQKSH